MLYHSKGRKVVGLLDYTIQREVRWFIHWVILFKGRKLVHSLGYTIQREGSWFIHWVRLFKEKKGDWFNGLYYSKGRKVVHSLGYTIQKVRKVVH